MTAWYPFAALAALLGAAPAEPTGFEFRYHGSFAKVARDGDTTGEPVKRFDLCCLFTPTPNNGHDLAFVLDEHAGGGWPWPARFGTTAIDGRNRPATHRMRLLYDHEGAQSVMTLPCPLFEFSDKLASDARWQAPRESDFANQRDAAPWKYRVTGSAKIGSRVCWVVRVTNNFGPQESVWIEKATSRLVKLERRVVIGRGELHLLKMELDSLVPLDEEQLKRLKRPLDTLMSLQQQLKRADDDKSPELSNPQLKSAVAALKDLSASAERTPFETLVAAIERDVKAQSRRSGDVESLAKQFVGKPAPPLNFKSLEGDVIDPATHARKIVLLHFWSYEGDPFPPEPYGQVGYVDYLYNRRKKLGVQVYGVAVDKRLSDPSRAGAVIRSVRKLQNFMNLSYPLVQDEGGLLEKFGDPERVGAKLPLWVLIDPAGTVVEYKLGNYEIHAHEGLRKLDESILALIKKQRQAAKQDSK